MQNIQRLSFPIPAVQLYANLLDRWILIWAFQNGFNLSVTFVVLKILSNPIFIQKPFIPNNCWCQHKQKWKMVLVRVTFPMQVISGTVIVYFAPFWQMKVTVKTRPFWFFWENEIVVVQLNFMLYWFSSKCFHFSDNFFKKEGTHIFKFFWKMEVSCLLLQK